MGIGPYDYVFRQAEGGLKTRKLSIVLSLRGAQRRGNLLVPSIEMHSSIDALYREIATALRASQ